jgi:hypothetical protein
MTAVELSKVTEMQLPLGYETACRVVNTITEFFLLGGIESILLALFITIVNEWLSNGLVEGYGLWAGFVIAPFLLIVSGLSFCTKLAIRFVGKISAEIRAERGLPI